MQREREVGIYVKQDDSENVRFDVELETEVEEYDCLGTLPLVLEKVDRGCDQAWRIGAAADEWHSEEPSGRRPEQRTAAAAATELTLRKWWETGSARATTSEGSPITTICGLAEAAARLARIDEAIEFMNDPNMRAVECEVTAKGGISAATGQQVELGKTRGMIEELTGEFIRGRHLELVRWINSERNRRAQRIASAYNEIRPALETWSPSEREE